MIETQTIIYANSLTDVPDEFRAEVEYKVEVRRIEKQIFGLITKYLTPGLKYGNFWSEEFKTREAYEKLTGI